MNPLVPQHIAIIMDGNRRWAKIHDLSVDEGHQIGAENIGKIVEAACKLGVKFITVYTLSTENIKERSKVEVLGLFNIIRDLFSKKLPEMIKNGIKIEVLGQKKGLPFAIQKIIDKAVSIKVPNKKFTLCLAINYGGRREIVDALKKILKDKVKSEKINFDSIRKYLYTKNIPDPDLMIRTGGNIRISNFLIWQIAYSELYFTKKFWPEFKETDLKKAILWYQSQQRNFGK